MFTALYASLSISYDGFIRTSSTPHKAVAQDVFARATAAGDVYFGTYAGWYNERLHSRIMQTCLPACLHACIYASI